MKTLFVHLLLLGLFQDTVGQLSGKLETAGGQPIPFANVLLLHGADTSLAKAALTDEAGNFSFPEPVYGTYTLRISSIGYETWDSPLFELTASQKGRNFGTQIMKKDPKQLGAVTIRGVKPLFQQQAYGTIVNVESSVLTKGSSALEVLERSPGITINRRDNSIQLLGKSGVAIMLNGKPVRMSMEQLVSFLNGMSADDISK